MGEFQYIGKYEINMNDDKAVTALDLSRQILYSYRTICSKLEVEAASLCSKVNSRVCVCVCVCTCV